MSGQDIIIEQLRADVERLRDDRADLQERCNRLSAEKAEALRMLEEAERERDAYKRAKEENDERFMRERDEWKARHDTLADVSRACIATAERERDEARAERDARPDISVDDAAMTVGFPMYADAVEARARVREALRAHAAKVKP